MRLRGCTTNSLREALRVLRRAEELLTSPDRWTRNAWARDAVGAPVGPVATSAVAWCLGGAVIRADHDLFGRKSVRVELDPTRRAVVVQGPKRMVVALRLLALPTAFAAFSAENRRGTASDAGAPGAENTTDVDLSVVAVWANDLQQTSYDHILLALAWAIDDVRAELSDRRGAPGR